MNNKIIYVCDSASRPMNFNYFLEMGLDDNPNNTFIFVHNNMKNALYIPIEKENVVDIEDEYRLVNDGYKIGMIYLEKTYPIDELKNSTFFFLSSSLIGPFMPKYVKKSWIEVFRSKLNDNVKIVSYDGNYSYLPTIDHCCFCVDYNVFKMMVNSDYQIGSNISKSICDKGYSIYYLSYKHQDIFPLYKSWKLNSIEGLRLNNDGDNSNLIDKIFVCPKDSNERLLFHITYNNLEFKHKEDSLYVTYGSIHININVTKKFRKLFVKDDKIHIDEDEDFNIIFGDVFHYCPKFLKIRTKNYEYVIGENHLTFDADIYKEKSDISYTIKGDINIQIVYFIYINPSINWQNIVCGQLINLKKIGLLEFAHLNIHIVCPEYYLSKVTDIINTLVGNYMVSITNTSENENEYRGIKLIYNLSNENPDDIFLYMHSKGISYNNLDRRLDEMILFQETINPWRRVLEIFEEDDNINKVGFGSSHDGSMWFNFWWTRGRYLSTCYEPQLIDDRWYYENWLSQNDKYNPSRNSDDCYSLCVNKSGISFDSPQVCKELNYTPLVIEI